MRAALRRWRAVMRRSDHRRRLNYAPACHAHCRDGSVSRGGRGRVSVRGRDVGGTRRAVGSDRGRLSIRGREEARLRRGRAKAVGIVAVTSDSRGAHRLWHVALLLLIVVRVVAAYRAVGPAATVGTQAAVLFIGRASCGHGRRRWLPHGRRRLLLRLLLWLLLLFGFARLESRSLQDELNVVRIFAPLLEYLKRKSDASKVQENTEISDYSGYWQNFNQNQIDLKILNQLVRCRH